MEQLQTCPAMEKAYNFIKSPLQCSQQYLQNHSEQAVIEFAGMLVCFGIHCWRLLFVQVAIDSR